MAIKIDEAQRHVSTHAALLQGQLEQLAYLAEQAGRMQALETLEQYAARRAAYNRRINEIVASVADTMLFLHRVYQ